MAEQMDNGMQTFLDQNGDPLAAGQVFLYTPGTNNYKPSWQDRAGTIVNTQPVVLDQAGRAIIWGIGDYRQVVEDQFGNVQWDRTTSAGVTLSVPGQVTGDLNVTGNAIINGSLQANSLNVNNETVSGTLSTGTLDASAINNSGLLTTNDIHTNDLTVNTQSTFNGLLQGTQGFFTHLQTSNTLSDDTNTNTLTVNNSANINSLLVDNVTTFNGPLEMHSNLDVLAGYSIDIQGGGIQVNTIQTYNSGLVQCGSNLAPTNDNAETLGTGSLGWSVVYAHNYVTLSTDATSALLADGMLDVVKAVPIKTLPHVGIAKEDLSSYAWAQAASGVNYDIIVGALWKALQELSAKFDAYVVAHP